MASPRVAIVHEWLTGMRGGEKCVEALCEIFPDATLFTLLHIPGSVSPTIEHMEIRTSFIQKLPFAAERYRYYLPLFPLAVDQFDLRGFDIVISSNHCVAKGVRTGPDSLHICYCYTPMRYIWDQYDDYFGKGRAGIVTRIGMKAFLGYLRRWDTATAANPHFYIAISENVKKRIERLYKRSSDIIYPPVNTTLFTPTEETGKYFLIVSAFVPYKRVDLAIEAFNITGDRLKIVGDGPDRDRLKRSAKENIEFIGQASDADLKKLYAGCQALIFPGEEDFGIVPVEALASGKPVIAYAKGGALETVREDGDIRSGVLFTEQNPHSLIAAVQRFKQSRFDPKKLASFAVSFDREVYKSKMLAYISERWESQKAKSRQPHI